jgi:mannonate dehydratase
LKREGAEKDYPQGVLEEVEKLKKTMTADDDHRLVENIIVKTQGFVSGNIKEGDAHPVELFRDLLALYKGITKEQLRENMRYFLAAIMPVCNEYDMYMCVHPDDPPFPILGLPRIVTNNEDINWFLHAVDDPHNGLTFCAGSLSAGAHNDVVKLARKYADRTWFVHMRSCHVFENGDFTEASHLGGRADLIELARIFEKTNPSLPMRVDHGMTMLGDESRGYNAGYSFLGRMFAMGQVQGILATVDRELGLEYKQPGFFGK